VGYDDMGFFGPWGDGPGAPEPLGAPGLVRFTPELTVAWEYPGEVPSTGASGSPGPVDDCAAIALGGDGACCFPDGSRLPAGVTMAGLGDTLDVFVGRDWYLVVVAELLGRHRERLGRARRAGGPGYASPRRDA